MREMSNFLNTTSNYFQLSIEKPTTNSTNSKTISITTNPSPHLLFAELNEQSTNNNNRSQMIKREFEQQWSSMSIRHHRPTLLFKTNNRIASTFKKKTINEEIPKQNKLNDLLSIHRYTATLSEQTMNYNRTLNDNLRSKSYSSKHNINCWNHHHQSLSERKNTNSKAIDNRSLSISPRLLINSHHEFDMKTKRNRKGLIDDECKFKIY